MNVSVNIRDYYRHSGFVAKREAVLKLPDIAVTTVISMDEDGYLDAKITYTIFTNHIPLKKIYYYNTFAYGFEDSAEVEDDEPRTIKLNTSANGIEEGILSSTTFVFDGDKYSVEVVVDHLHNSLFKTVRTVSARVPATVEDVITVETSLNPKFKKVTFYAASEDDLREFNKKLPEEVRLYGWQEQ